MFPQNCMGDARSQIRKRWLIFAIVSFVYPVIIAILSGLLLLRENSPLMVVICIHAIPFTLLYCCAYRKPGTRLLTFMIVGYLLGLIMMVTMTHTLPMFGPRILYYGHTCSSFFVAFGYLYSSIQLRKINIREQPLHRILKKGKISELRPATSTND